MLQLHFKHYSLSHFLCHNLHVSVRKFKMKFWGKNIPFIKEHVFSFAFLDWVLHSHSLLQSSLLLHRAHLSSWGVLCLSCGTSLLVFLELDAPLCSPSSILLHRFFSSCGLLHGSKTMSLLNRLSALAQNQIIPHVTEPNCNVRTALLTTSETSILSVHVTEYFCLRAPWASLTSFAVVSSFWENGLHCLIWINVPDSPGPATTFFLQLRCHSLLPSHFGVDGLFLLLAVLASTGVSCRSGSRWLKLGLLMSWRAYVEKGSADNCKLRRGNKNPQNVGWMQIGTKHKLKIRRSHI